MLKALAFGLGLTALVYPFNAAQAQYGKASQEVANPAALQASQSANTPSAKSTQGAEAGKAALPAAKTGQHITDVIPPVTMKKDEKIEIFFDDFNIKKTLGGQIFCQMTFYVNNTTEKMLDSLMVDISWPGIATNISFAGIEPGDLKTMRYALVGAGCYTMGEQPTLNVTRCLMRFSAPDGKIYDAPENVCKQAVIFK
jgi:hypothetical protein